MKKAVAAGATLHTAGDRVETTFPPAVLTDLDPSWAISKEEFFGPVALMVKAADEADAIVLANDSPFDLGSCIYGSGAELNQPCRPA